MIKQSDGAAAPPKKKERRITMKSYRYEVIAYINDIKVKRFIGNDIDDLIERFEMWFIKTNYDRNELFLYKGEIQHAGY
jgi:hypothetical protein